MRVANVSGFAALLGLAGMLLAVPVNAHEGAAGRVPQPAMSTPEGKECVQPEAVMRRDHMKYILHQRDKTMHEGVRTQQYSLKNCINCHADPKTGSVLGKDGFCESCHRYAAVSVDCFSCHSAEREASASAPPAPAARAAQDKKRDSARGQKP
jgi:hypothetical protein